MTLVPRWIVIGLSGSLAAGLGLWFGMTPIGGGMAAIGQDGSRRSETVDPSFPDGRVREAPRRVAGEVAAISDGVRRPAPLPQAKAFSAQSQRPGDDAKDAAVWSHYTPTREELEYRAFKVEQEANKELRNLLQVLDLDDERQDRVFAALVRSSNYFHPVLQPHGLAGGLVESRPRSALPADGSTDGSSLPSVPMGIHDGGDDDITPGLGAAPTAVLTELDPEEVDVYERYTSEREAFWAGIVEDIEKELNAQ